MKVITERIPTYKEILYAKKKAFYIQNENVITMNKFLLSRKNSIVLRLNAISKILKRISPLLNKYCYEEIEEMRRVREMMGEVEGGKKENNNTITNSDKARDMVRASENGEMVRMRENNTDITNNTINSITTNTDIIVKVSENNNTADKTTTDNNTTDKTTGNIRFTSLYQIYLQCITNKTNNLLLKIKTTYFAKQNTPP
ncbi:MAG: hypothetical protein Ta2D_11890 [Rickettsiales bacterium]|nr:MAG: hypothetical protein Ta2D_11890 [Rickettsiales bacterium]